MATKHTGDGRWQVLHGIVTDATIYKNQRHLYIFCPELLPYRVGDVTPATAVQRVSIINDADGVTNEFDVHASSTIYAEYFGTTSSFSVPTMVKGMQVLVLNYANTDRYFWLPLERDDHLKNFEHVRISCKNSNVIADSALTDIDQDDVEGKHRLITDDNTYFLEIDTKYKKHVLISTSNSDGEAWRYFIRIDANAHILELNDVCTDGSQPNNVIKMESRPGMDPTKKGRITLQTAGQATLILESEDMIIDVPRNMYVNVGGDIVRTTIGTELTKVSGDVLTNILGNKVEVVDGTLNSTVNKDATCIYKSDLFTVIEKEHNETQTTRITITDKAIWSSLTWYLSSKVSTEVVSTKTTLSLGVASCLATQLIVNNGALMLVGSAFTFNAQAMAITSKTMAVTFNGGSVVGAGQVLFP